MKQSKVTINPLYIRLENYLKQGAVDLLQVVEAINDYYKRGRLAYNEAEEAIRRLAKIKIK